VTLDRAPLAGSAVEAARALVGARLVREPDPDTSPTGGPASASARRIGRIVETEAYVGPDDQASHARFGETDRSRIMFGRPGVAYVYLVYGMYDCLNVVTEPVGRPTAVLLRAVEPLAGVDEMRAARLEHARRVHRGWDADRLAAEQDRLGRLRDGLVSSGPGAVAAAFSIDRSMTGLDLCDPGSVLRLEARPADEAAPDVRATRRIGIDYAGPPWVELPWRFVVAGHASASGPHSLR
jgi:DNA-3-methyladenine glycosylase